MCSPDPLPAGTRIACRIEYDGSRYNGWQSQPQAHSTTVQDTLELALSRVAAQPLRVQCAGRTDSGVHGFAQTIHFDSPVERSPKAWVLGTNANLPSDIRVHWAQAVPKDFHARFSAISRRYCYIIANTTIRPAHLNQQVTWYRHALDAQLMHREAQCLLGEQDFSAFRAAACQSNSPYRNVQSLAVTRRGSLVVIDIQANAFLHHMVRNIAGSLMLLGSGRQAVGWLAKVLAGRDRKLAADTAAADGLYLMEVLYPERFTLPAVPEGPLILGG
ncbi:tRNA pseudouridine(38-40) synthase TruA [Parahaliea sp. F7430]|uniref:tRNA pseudouridine synthase A n=1 Tax=Sediminihaliea albiluteola TaxID=2758564 RepID=A0A7W2YJ90_9GAMM|nr:tRNA pseudouridine(38-40) synthase TruA [Sediminihaliea albiluteola]MBA6412038.1 tRNA pseudouridine(38-40) synthase TruA [Sediminihaliea albiluteola]